MKKRIFIANDSNFIGSGYGVYGKEILSRLYNSGKYEIAELGCYADESNANIQSVPWKFYPNAVKTGDPLYETYRSNPVNQFGLWRFNRAILDFKPHIVFDVRDYWMSAYQEASPYRKHFHWILMPTVDSAPQKTEWYYTFANADIVVPYTEWAKKTLTEGSSGKLNIFPETANAGINPTEFYPKDNKTEHKIKYFGKNVDVVGAVMRNQKRKLLPDLMIAFKQYLSMIKDTEKYDNTYLYLHTSYPEENGWDLPNLLLEFGLMDKTYFSYICKNCNKYFPAKFNGAVTDCKHCNGKNCSFFSSVANSVSTESLNEIYNLFDIFIQYAICEGFGMPQIEAAACGLQIASVDYSAMAEIAESVDGIKIPVKRLFRELETNANRAYPDNEFTAQMLFKFFNETDNETKKNSSIRIREKCISKYTWDNVYSVWDRCFESIDISNKISWTTKDYFGSNHADMSVPQGLNPKEFVEYVCTQIINEPYLINTSGIQQIIKNLNTKLVTSNGTIKSFTFKDAIGLLEQYLNSKITFETMRHNEHQLKKESFLTCQK